VVIDSSAVTAILFNEPDHRRYASAIESASSLIISAVTRVELPFVIEGRKGVPGRARLDAFFAMTAVEIVAATEEQAQIACEAFRRFGKGRHGAALNIGDCFAYALAKATGQPLLFKGSDFSQTDIVAALIN
jgi:ribonuclease VapC